MHYFILINAHKFVIFFFVCQFEKWIGHHSYWSFAWNVYGICWKNIHKRTIQTSVRHLHWCTTIPTFHLLIYQLNHIKKPSAYFHDVCNEIISTILIFMKMQFCVWLFAATTHNGPEHQKMPIENAKHIWIGNHPCWGTLKESERELGVQKNRCNSVYSKFIKIINGHVM